MATYSTWPPPVVLDMDYYGNYEDISIVEEPPHDGLDDWLRVLAPNSPTDNFTPGTPARSPSKKSQHSSLTSPEAPVLTPSSSDDHRDHEESGAPEPEGFSSSLSSDGNLYDDLLYDQSASFHYDHYLVMEDTRSSTDGQQSSDGAHASGLVNDPAIWPHSAPFPEWLENDLAPGIHQQHLEYDTGVPISQSQTRSTQAPSAAISYAQVPHSYSGIGQSDVDQSGFLYTNTPQVWHPQPHNGNDSFGSLSAPGVPLKSSPNGLFLAHQGQSWQPFAPSVHQQGISLPSRTTQHANASVQRQPTTAPQRKQTRTTQTSRDQSTTMLRLQPPSSHGYNSTNVPASALARSQHYTYAARPEQARMLHAPALHVSTQPASLRAGPSATQRISPIQPSASSKSGSVASPVLRRSEPHNRRNRGGRQRDMHLPDLAKKKIHAMRQRGACWTCALQRDPCEEGDPCPRCQAQSQRARPHHFGCDRSKLWELVDDFLPSSMTLMHTKQPILEAMLQNVAETSNMRIKVFLTCGCGPWLPWDLCSFRPKGDDITVQLQYIKNPQTGRCERRVKRSLPLMIPKLDGIDADAFSSYLDLMLGQQYLWGFGWKCFEEEEDDFQTRLLQYLCGLYLNVTQQSGELKTLLRQSIRMIVVTYIMGHTLTLADETVNSVLAHLGNSFNASELGAFPSPRLANRQFKYFFATIRNRMYQDVLKALHNLLRGSKKQATWLSAFCIMIALAMVLEEDQRTLHIQADAKVSKGEAGSASADAEACRACATIDGRFQFLMALFQGKYKARNATHGSFGENTPELTEPIERQFAQEVYNLLQEKRGYLQQRRDVPIAHENETQYTSRLVARFLLPFLETSRGN